MSRIEKALEKAIQHKGGDFHKAGDLADLQNDHPNDHRSDHRSDHRNDHPRDFKRDDGTGSNAKDLIPIEMKTDVASSLLISASEPDSFIAEEYRKLKEILIKRSLASDKFRNTYMISSAMTGEGKTLTSLNLAISLAREYDYTTLLIDADLRGPSCSDVLNLPVKPGLTDYLLNNKSLSECLIDTGIGKLKFLPAGGRVANPAEIISTQKMRELINEIKLRYKDRFVIIDTAPILPFSESRIISKLVDDVVIVVREKHSSLENLKDCLDAIKGASIAGLVYNDAKITKTVNDYGYYSYKYYRKKNIKSKRSKEKGSSGA
jgi:exopolysaccharide/PEP-CTERM locus tyrosine autokinase